MRPARLDAAAVTTALNALNQHCALAWTIQEDQLQKTFRFHDFREAFAFMSRTAETAEAMNHHPDWRNIYNRVHVTLSTHDAGGLTELDFQLAAAMEHLAS